MIIHRFPKARFKERHPLPLSLDVRHPKLTTRYSPDCPNPKRRLGIHNLQWKARGRRSVTYWVFSIVYFRSPAL